MQNMHSLVQNTAYTLTFSVILHVQGGFFLNSFLSLSLFFPQTKNTSCKTHCFLPCQVCSGRRWRQQTAGPPCSESGLPLSGLLPAKQT